jgi:hypothetical protein
MLQRHVSYHWTTSQGLGEKQALVFGPGKGSCTEHLPVSGYKIRGTSECPGGTEEGVDG